MFRKILKPNRTLFAATKRHCTSFQNRSPSADLNTVFPLDQQSILSNLKNVSTSSEVYKEFSILSTLNTTAYSKTSKVYSNGLNQSMSLKSIQLESPSSWEQLNLILRQNSLQKKALANIQSIHFNEKDKIVNVLTECSENILSDSLKTRAQSKVLWKSDELTLLSWQILHQINALQQLGATMENPINPKNLFIDAKANMFKLYDFSDFKISAGKAKEEPRSSLESFAGPPPLLNETILSLVRLMYPDAWINNAKDARGFLEANYSDFMYQLELIEAKLRELDGGSKENFANRLENEVMKIIGEQKLFYENVEEYMKERKDTTQESKANTSSSTSKGVDDWSAGSYKDMLKDSYNQKSQYGVGNNNAKDYVYSNSQTQQQQTRNTSQNTQAKNEGSKAKTNTPPPPKGPKPDGLLKRLARKLQNLLAIRRAASATLGLGPEIVILVLALGILVYIVEFVEASGRGSGKRVPQMRPEKRVVRSVPQEKPETVQLKKSFREYLLPFALLLVLLLLGIAF